MIYYIFINFYAINFDIFSSALQDLCRIPNVISKIVKEK